MAVCTGPRPKGSGTGDLWTVERTIFGYQLVHALVEREAGVLYRADSQAGIHSGDRSTNPVLFRGGTWELDRDGAALPAPLLRLYGAGGAVGPLLQHHGSQVLAGQRNMQPVGMDRRAKMGSYCCASPKPEYTRLNPTPTAVRSSAPPAHAKRGCARPNSARC